MGGTLQKDVRAAAAGKGLLADAREIIESARAGAYRAVNAALVQRNWLLGKRIAEEELKGERAEYGRQAVKELAEQLTEEYGAGFDFGSLYKYVQFYRTFPILETLSPKSGGLLGWSHYLKLLQVENAEARKWYLDEAASETWSVRTLQRNISSQYYERTLLSQSKGAVKAEMRRLTAPLQDRLEFVKNPVVAEFLGLAPRTDFTESDLETRILDNLGKFLMEMGKGYAFVARQYRIHTEKEDYFIDLVFYNYLLKCFVLVDLKTSKITHQDVGQMDMYVRMFDEKRRGEGDNPTLGILLCADTDSDVARYSVLKGSEQLFASKYVLVLPSAEALRAEIEAQKAIFEAQHPTRAATRRLGEGEEMCLKEGAPGYGTEGKERQKPVVYLETSFVSYLTARKPKDPKNAAKQEATLRWWEEEGPKWHPVVSEAVRTESEDGDQEAVGRRMAFMEDFESMDVSAEAEALATRLMEAIRLQEKYRTDAVHMALAAIRGADLLLSWNCRHIANSATIPKVVATLAMAGYACPAIATPRQRLEERDND